MQQPDISTETLDISDCSDLFVALLIASSVDPWPPKGGGGCFPGRTNNLTNSFRIVSAIHGKRSSPTTF